MKLLTSWAASEGPSKEASAEWIWETKKSSKIFQSFPKTNPDHPKITGSRAMFWTSSIHWGSGVPDQRRVATTLESGGPWRQEASNNCGWFAMCIYVCYVPQFYVNPQNNTKYTYIDIMCIYIYIQTSLSLPNLSQQIILARPSFSACHDISCWGSFVPPAV